MRKITFRNLRKSKRQVPQPHLPRRARVAELWTNWRNYSGTFTIAPVRWPVVHRKHDVSRKTDQSMIEAAKVMFHKLLGEGREGGWSKGRLGLSDAAVTRRSLYRDQAEQAAMFAYRDIENESLSSPRGIERKICTSNVNRNAIAAIFSRDTGASYRG